LVVLPDTFTFSNRAAQIALAARHGLPAIYALRGQAIDGGLLSYGPDTIDLYRRAAGYVDRVLKGEKPADLHLPVTCLSFRGEPGIQWPAGTLEIDASSINNVRARLQPLVLGRAWEDWATSFPRKAIPANCC
jgi:hypothetical protein